MKNKNMCMWSVESGNAKAPFNIYQAKNGSIRMLIGNKTTVLNQNQILELDIDVYSLIDFDYELYKKYYAPQDNNTKKLTYEHREIKIGAVYVKEVDARYNAGYNDALEEIKKE